MAEAGSSMILGHLAALRSMKGKQVEAGWFESARYKSATPGAPGVSVARIARLQNYGGIIEHPGGTKYITDAAVGGKNARMLGTRFVKNSFQGEHKTTSAHLITIPARPFMQLAWKMFSENRATIQKGIARKLVTGEMTIDNALAAIGLALEGYIAKSMKNGNWTPNAPSTARAKGFNKPLINTAHMLQSVSSIVT